MDSPAIKNKGSVILVSVLLILFGIFCIYYSLVLYGDTIINFTTLLIILGLSSIVGYIIIKRVMYFSLALSTPRNSALNYIFFSVFVFGATCTCLLLFTNKYLSVSRAYILKQPILERSVMNTTSHPSGKAYSVHYVTFEMMGKKRTTGFDEETGNANFIEVYYKKGLWGYDVIIGYKLLP